jgi:hypothetical protein
MDFSPEDVRTRLKSSVMLQYADNVTIRHSSRELAINRYVWSLLELFPTMPLLSKYSVHNYYSEGWYVAKTINKAFEAMLEDIVHMNVTGSDTRKCLETVYQKMYQILEDVYNNVIYNNLEYVSSLNITDFLEIQMAPELLAAIDDVRVKQDLPSVMHTYDVLDDVIRNTPELRENPIASGYIAGTISSAQVKQLLGSRGFVTEIDSTIFKYPIASSFVLGLDNMYEIAAESRSGAKALYLSNRAISMSEYFAREMQLCTMGVEHLVDGDCGNKDHLEWTITEHDFKNLLGKHYFLDSKELVITEQDKHLIGQTVQLRSSLHCKMSNKRSVCTACFGELSSGVPMHANVGHISVTILSSVISQMILSTKHITKSASSDTVALSGIMKDFFIIRDKDGVTTYVFRASSITRKRYSYRLHIPQEQASGITDIKSAVDVKRLNLTRLSRLTNIEMTIGSPDGSTETVVLEIKQGTREGSFTAEFLEHIKEHGYELDDQDRFVIDLEGWKPGVAFIALPQIEFSYIDLAKACKEAFKSVKSKNVTPEAFLYSIFELVNNKLNVNLALLEVVVYAFMASDAENGNYDFGRNTETAIPVSMRDIMRKRSVGGAYAWEYVMSTMLSPSSYYGKNAVDHPLDVLLKPNECLKCYN